MSKKKKKRGGGGGGGGGNILKTKKQKKGSNIGSCPQVPVIENRGSIDLFHINLFLL